MVKGNTKWQIFQPKVVFKWRILTKNRTKEFGKMKKSQEMLADMFGQNVFSDKVMQTRLPQNVYKTLHPHGRRGR